MNTGTLMKQRAGRFPECGANRCTDSFQVQRANAHDLGETIELDPGLHASQDGRFLSRVLGSDHVPRVTRGTERTSPSLVRSCPMLSPEEQYDATVVQYAPTIISAQVKEAFCEEI